MDKRKILYKAAAIILSITAIGGLIYTFFGLAIITMFWAGLGKGLGAQYPIRDDGPPKHLFGCIDKDGKTVLPFKYRWLDSFHEGLAVTHGTEYSAVVDDQVLLGYIDKSGKMAIVPRFLNAEAFSEGLAVARENRRGSKWCYIDKLGKQAICEGYTTAHKFHNGKAYVEETEEDDSPGSERGSKTVKSFVIDKDNKVLKIDPMQFLRKEQESHSKPELKTEFDTTNAISEGMALVCKNNKWGVVDAQGKVIVPPQFLDAKDFSQGRAAVQQTNQLWGYIDKKGQMVIPAAYTNAESFSEGLAVVEKKCSEETSEQTGTGN